MMGSIFLNTAVVFFQVTVVPVLIVRLAKLRAHPLIMSVTVTPGVTITLRIRAACEIGCIDLAGLDWCDVGAVVELPLHGAERSRVLVKAGAMAVLTRFW
jgi:hypothetical protein